MTPPSQLLLARLTRRARRLAARMAPGGACHCVVCDRAVRGFLPYRGGWSAATPVLREKRVIGSDLDRFECPACGSNDRERHLVHYFRRLGLFEQIRGRAVLHFAPEKHFAAFVARAAPARQVQADLFPAGPGIERMDLLAIPCAEASFDFVIANHVLEHVDDDRKALAELHRVLKPGGTAILQTPFSAVLAETTGDPAVRDPGERLRLYGQEDHVRLFGQDIFARFAAAGFVDRVVWHDAVLADVDPWREGVNRAEPLFRFERG